MLAGLAGLCVLTGCASRQPAVSAAGSLPSSSSSSSPSLSLSPSQSPSLSLSGAVADGSLTGIHACELVPASVVTRVLGPLLERPYETGDGLECFYNTAAPGGGGPSYILTVTTRSGYEAAKAFAEGVAESGSKLERYSSAHDLGDDTFSTSADNGAPDYSLWAAKAGLGVNVSVNDLRQGVSRAHDLVAAALSRL